MRFLRERWRLFLGLMALGVLLLGVGVSGCVAWTNRKGVVSVANCQRIHKGMTRMEVEKVLGGPGQPSQARFLKEGSQAAFQVQQWRGRRIRITVAFEDDVVVFIARTEHLPRDWWETLQDYLIF